MLRAHVPVPDLQQRGVSGPYEDFRAQQCAKRNSYYVHENAKHSWIPYEPDDVSGALFPPPPAPRGPWASAGSLCSQAGAFLCLAYQ